MFCRSCVLVAVVLMTLSCLTQALIVPQEVPSILSLVYSNIPPIRKGTDSRLGFGFRLGEHADFQVVVELGPQKDTRPIGMNQDDDDSSSRKRQVNPNDYKKFRRPPAPITTTTTTYRPPLRTAPTTSSNDFAWLREWFGEWTETAKKKNPTRNPVNKVQNRNSINNDITKKGGYLKTAPIIPESSLKQLQQLYKMATMDPIVVEDTTTPSPSLSLPSPSPFSLPSSNENTNNNEITPLSVTSTSRLNILSTRQAIPARKTKGEITDELMDVNLD